MSKNEIWKDVPGYNGIYQASNFGEVRRTIFKNGTSEFPKIKVLKKCLNSHGYFCVDLSIGNSSKTIKVSRIVASTFCSNPHGYNVVNHIDADKTNDSADNLEWCSIRMNCEHASDLGLYSSGKNRKKPVIRSDGLIFESISMAAEYSGASKTTIRDIVDGKHKTFNGYGFSAYHGEEQIWGKI